MFAEHLILHCVFAREVWLLVVQWVQGLVTMPPTNITVEQWWNSSLQGRSKEEGRWVARRKGDGSRSFNEVSNDGDKNSSIDQGIDEPAHLSLWGRRELALFFMLVC